MMSKKSGFSSSIIRCQESYVRGMWKRRAASAARSGSRSITAAIFTSGMRDQASN